MADYIDPSDGSSLASLFMRIWNNFIACYPEYRY